jgi:hypothetical protein
MNWLCEGVDLLALRDDRGLLMHGKAVIVIRRDLIRALMVNNRSYRNLIERNGVQEYISGPHAHAVWKDSVRRLKL